MNKIECFKIQVIETENLFDFSNSKLVKKIECQVFNCFREPITIVADPFLYVEGDRLYLFYEKKYMYKPGVIAMMSTDDLINWTDPIDVLSENFHLSYPWVFKDGNDIYMIPETGENHAITLYQAQNGDLSSFKFVKEILHNDKKCTIDFADSSIYKKNGKYYLMTTVNENGLNKLRLYISDKIDGNYVEHTQSPIVCSNKYGRNAGCMFEYKNELFRVAQDCNVKYGDDVHIFKVLDIDDNRYEERLMIPNFLTQQGTFYKNGGHQLNWVEFNGKYIVATDAKEYHYMIIQRILHKLKIY